MLLLLLCGVTMAPLCGKRRPPLPPIERIPQRTEALTALQRGNQIILSWPAPRLDAPAGSVQSIRRVDVYRVHEKPNAPLPMTEDEFAARSTLVGSVSYEELQKAAGTVTYADTLDLAGEPARLRYAVRYVNANGQRAGFSNFVLMEPAAKIAAAPVLDNNPVYSELAITLNWQPPKANIDDSTPVNVLGYNVYRATDSAASAAPTLLNRDPITATQYPDKTFKFGEKYTYFVRAVSLGSEALPVESADSNAVTATQIDKYPPAAPLGLSVTPAPGRIALFWSANTEPDLAGYIVLRSTDPNLPIEKWTHLTQEIYTKTTFEDRNVETGTTYYYSIVAVDKAGNQSHPSEVQSEKGP